MGGLRLFCAAAAAVLLVATPALAGNAWGYDVGGVVFSRYTLGVGPSVGASPGPAGDPAGANTRLVMPGANELSVRAFVRGVQGEPISGAAVNGILVVQGSTPTTHVLAFRETVTPEGSTAYDAQRVPYQSGSAAADLTFDFDRDGLTDATLRIEYRALS